MMCHDFPVAVQFILTFILLSFEFSSYVYASLFFSFFFNFYCIDRNSMLWQSM